MPIRSRFLVARARLRATACPPPSAVSVVGDLLHQSARLGDESFKGGDVVAVGASRCPPSVLGLEGEAELRELLSALLLGTKLRSSFSCLRTKY